MGAMKSLMPFQPSDDLDLQVRALIRAMLEPIDLTGREELLAQIPSVSVVGRYGLDCMLEVTSGTPRAPVSSDKPIVCAPVDAEPEDVERFGEPYVGELELFVRKGFLRLLVYSGWFAPTKLPDPVAIHPTAEVTGYIVVDESRYRKGQSFDPGHAPLSREE
jgi:hypothetical protein